MRKRIEQETAARSSCLLHGASLAFGLGERYAKTITATA